VSDKAKSSVFMYKNKPKKYLGQNFLKSDKYAQIAVNELGIELLDNVLEIGPGNGALTKHILPISLNSLTLVEFDRDLIAGLKLFTKDQSKAQILNQNILDEDVNVYQKIIGAIPYNITTPIIHKLLAKPPYAKIIVLIIQKEVAQKICNKNLNYFNLLTFFYDKKIVSHIKNTEFYPAPKVDSSIIKFTLNQNKLDIFDQKIENINQWSKYLHQLFRNPRKKIKSSFNVEFLEKALINQDLRAHQLSLEDVINLYLVTKKHTTLP